MNPGKSLTEYSEQDDVRMGQTILTELGNISGKLGELDKLDSIVQAIKERNEIERRKSMSDVELFIEKLEKLLENQPGLKEQLSDLIDELKKGYILDATVLDKNDGVVRDTNSKRRLDKIDKALDDAIGDLKWQIMKKEEELRDLNAEESTYKCEHPTSEEGFHNGLQKIKKKIKQKQNEIDNLTQIQGLLEKIKDSNDILRDMERGEIERKTRNSDRNDADAADQGRGGNTQGSSDRNSQGAGRSQSGGNKVLRVHMRKGRITDKLEDEYGNKLCGIGPIAKWRENRALRQLYRGDIYVASDVSKENLPEWTTMAQLRNKLQLIYPGRTIVFDDEIDMAGNVASEEAGFFASKFDHNRLSVDSAKTSKQRYCALMALLGYKIRTYRGNGEILETSDVPEKISRKATSFVPRDQRSLDEQRRDAESAQRRATGRQTESRQQDRDI